MHNKRRDTIVVERRNAQKGAAPALASVQVLEFEIAGQAYALHMSAVERVMRAVKLTGLPGAPPVILGMYSMYGVPVPVADVRHRLGLAKKEVDPGDQYIVVRTAHRLLAIVSEAMVGIVEHPAARITSAKSVMQGAACIAGILQIDERLILIQDLDRFLSLDEERALQEAMDEAGNH